MCCFERSSTEMKRGRMARTRAKVGAVAALVLLLPGVAGRALAAPATDPPRPLPSGTESSVRVGERLTVTTEALVSGDAFSGVRVTSAAFAADGTLRMDDTVLVAVVTVSCKAEPGSYEVRFSPPLGDENVSGTDRLWGRVRVAQADAAERATCVRQTAVRPPESQEERYPAGTQWPASPWDVRSVQAGGQLKATDGTEMGSDGGVTLSSPGFTQPVVMHGDKLVSATVRIRCDAKPGLYEVHWAEKGASATSAKVWARYRVTAGDPDCRDSAAPQVGKARRAAPWLVGGVLVVIAAGVALRILARSRRQAPR